jgi:ABC-2 type transport system ATP-binding protein
MKHAISVKNLSKIYNGKESKCAVNNICFNVNQGELVAFLGPNGAGKSTTIKILCGILSASSGEANILGFKAGSFDAKKNLGLIFGTRSQLFLHMTVEQSLNIIAEIYFVSGKEKLKRIDELGSLFQIKPFFKQRVRSLSLGERMRCEIASALIHKPKVLLADEPTIGLDIASKIRLRTLIKEWQQHEKATLILTSHDLSDVEILCNRCILINKGNIVYDGLLAKLKQNFSNIKRISVTLSQEGILPYSNSHQKIIRKDTSKYCTHIYEIDKNDVLLADFISHLFSYYKELLHDIKIEEITLDEVLYELFQTKHC